MTAARPPAVLVAAVCSAAVLAFAVLGGLDGRQGLETAALGLLVGATLLLDIEVLDGGRVPLGAALVIALAYLLPPARLALVVGVGLATGLPVVSQRAGGPPVTAMVRWCLPAAAAAVAVAAIERGPGLGTSNVAIVVVVLVAGVAYLATDLAVDRARGRGGDPRLRPSSAWGAWATLLSAAALVAVGARYQHSGGNGNPWTAAIAFCPLLIAWYSFERYAQARRTYRQTIRALSIVPEAAGLVAPGHAERCATYADALARRLGMGDNERERVVTAALLHHVGSLSLGEEDEAEPAEPQRVASLGADLLQRASFLADVADLVGVAHGPAAASSREAAVVQVAGELDDRVGDTPQRAMLALQALQAGAREGPKAEVVAALAYLLTDSSTLVEEAIASVSSEPVAVAAGEA